MWAELWLISVWGRSYLLQEMPDEIDKAAWQARRCRLAEIRKELDKVRDVRSVSVTNLSDWILTIH